MNEKTYLSTEWNVASVVFCKPVPFPNATRIPVDGFISQAMPDRYESLLASYNNLSDSFYYFFHTMI